MISNSTCLILLLVETVTMNHHVGNPNVFIGSDILDNFGMPILGIVWPLVRLIPHSVCDITNCNFKEELSSRSKPMNSSWNYVTYWWIFSVFLKTYLKELFFFQIFTFENSLICFTHLGDLAACRF